MENGLNSEVQPPTPDKTVTRNSKERTKKKYLPSIDLSALRALVGTTTSSFTDLAEAVILVNGVPYDRDTLPMSKARKMDYERLIAHYAKLEIYGSRKYHVKSVFTRIEKEIENDIELKIDKKAPYSKAKPLTEAQKDARNAIYREKREIAKRAKERKDEQERLKAEKEIADLKELEKQRIEQEKQQIEQEKQKAPKDSE